MSKARDLANASTALGAVTATELAFVDGVTSAIQTQLDAKTAKSTLTTTGDIYYASAANTPARLGIGSTDQVLKVTAGVPAWATPTGGGANFSLLGTNNPASTTTSSFTSISGKNELFLTFTNVLLASTNGTLTFRINSDSDSNYLSNGFFTSGTGTGLAPAVFEPRGGGTHMGTLKADNADYSSGYVKISGCNTTGSKPYQIVWFAYDGSKYYGYSAGGIWNNASTVTSFDVTSTNNFSAGAQTTIKLYGSAA
jgi:hypothetical protein